MISRSVDCWSSLTPYPLYQDGKETILVKAARLGSEEVVDLLLQAGAVVNAKNKVTSQTLIPVNLEYY